MRPGKCMPEHQRHMPWQPQNCVIQHAAGADCGEHAGCLYHGQILIQAHDAPAVCHPPFSRPQPCTHCHWSRVSHSVEGKNCHDLLLRQDVGHNCVSQEPGQAVSMAVAHHPEMALTATGHMFAPALMAQAVWQLLLQLQMQPNQLQLGSRLRSHNLVPALSQAGLWQAIVEGYQVCVAQSSSSCVAAHLGCCPGPAAACCGLCNSQTALSAWYIQKPDIG